MQTLSDGSCDHGYCTDEGTEAERWSGCLKVRDMGRLRVPKPVVLVTAIVRSKNRLAPPVSSGTVLSGAHFSGVSRGISPRCSELGK
jgi:hypothetical protein